jgi:hypothetical protein
MVSHMYILTFSLTFYLLVLLLLYSLALELELELETHFLSLLSFCAAWFVGVSWVCHSLFLYTHANALGFRLAGVVVVEVSSGGGCVHTQDTRRLTQKQL